MTLNPITDLQLWQQMLLYAAPLIIAAMGELLIERSGILNVAIEGMMLVAAVVCFVAAFQTESPLLGMAAAMAATGLMALVLAYYGITLRGSQITVGLGLYVLGIGLSSLIYRVVFGVRLTPPRVATLGPLPVPGLADIPVLGPIVFQQNVLVYVALLLVPAVHLFLYATPLGLRIRATGENPRAVDALGLDVAALRYGATVVGGLLIGLGGAYLPLTLTGTFSDNMTAGRGFIALAAMIFGNWRPFGAFYAALLFGFSTALAFRLPVYSSTAATLFQTLPYVLTLIAVAGVIGRTVPPAADGRPYKKQ